ncbi:MAG: exo-beta-N-acetylmuramidase NamZ domain-containing protein [Bacteroidaceae bacterium]
MALLGFFPSVLSADGPAPIRPGAERTEAYLPLLNGKRVALVVNQTSRIGQTHLLDTLLRREVRIQKVFAPEHGFRGDADAGEQVRDGKDAATGIPLVSLYGKNKKPTAAQLADVDVVVFDIQDVGARFYTYISTLHYVMEACAAHGKEFIVLDRPNPCDYVDGPIRQKGFQSFVGLDPIPLLHGCTVGELARMMEGEKWLGNASPCRLTVVAVEGWRHGEPYSLPVKPSPNLPNDLSVAYYPSLCLFEATRISVGRGTTFPFQTIGAPDTRYGTFAFTPTPLPGFDKHPLHQGKTCYGIDLRRQTPPSGLSLQYLLQFYRLSGEGAAFFANPRWFDLLMGNDQVRQDILDGKSEEEIRARWKADLEAYKRIREKYLLYRERPAIRN